MATAPCPQVSLPDASQVFKMLADETRLRLLLLLGEQGDTNVSSLCASTGQSQTATSQHLALLRLSGIVTYRREGKRNIYSLASEYVRDLLKNIKY